MALNFPEDTSQDYVAPNGVVYRYEDNRWRTKTFEVEDFDDKYLQLTGGEVTGRLDVTGPVFVPNTSTVFKRTDATAGNSYIISVEAPLLDPDGVNYIAFRVTADGSVKAGHSASAPFKALVNNDVVTKAYADENYLSLTGGEVTGPLLVNNLLEVKEDAVEYQKNRTSITQMSSREIINAGILDNLMRDPSQYGYLTGLATEQYVDDKVDSLGGSRQVAFTYTQTNEEPDSGNIAGKFGLTNDNLDSVLNFDDAKVIWFSATDFDGNKPFHSWTRDVSTYAPGPLYLLRNNEMQWMLQGGAAAGGGVYIEYSKDFDVFLLWWTGTQVSARLGDFSGLTNGGLYDLYIPNLTKI